jgi:hypothetical protein
VVRIGVTRVGPSSQAAAVRGWDDQQVSAANVLIRDFEAPIGVPVTYTVTGHDSGGAVVDTSTLTLTVTSAGCSDTWLNDLARVGNTMRILIEALPELDYKIPAAVHEHPHPPRPDRQLGHRADPGPRAVVSDRRRR